MNKALIGVLDYGIGNTLSVKRILDNLNFNCRLISTPEDLQKSQCIIIPGVGSFPAAMRQLNQTSLTEGIKDLAKSGKGVVGICLGMQLLSDVSYEQGSNCGLGLIPGRVKAIDTPSWHIGWNNVDIAQAHSLFDSQSQGDFYFNHSYEFCTDDRYILGETNIGRPLVSMINKDNIYGLQFHPEKSQHNGAILMKTVVEAAIHA